MSKALAAAIPIGKFRTYFDKLNPKDELILDVRSHEEFADGHIPGAKNIPHGVVANHVGELRNYKNIYVYCHAGGRVQMACLVLESLGLNNLTPVLGGGMPEWEEAGNPVER